MNIKVTLCSALAAFTLSVTLPAHALVINATFGTAYDAQSQAAVNTAISYFESVLTNNVSLNIDFASMTSGLGSSTQYIYGLSYDQVYSALNAKKTSANDISAVNSLVNGSSDPGSGKSTVGLTHADCAVLGLNCAATPNGYDGTISINLGSVDATRSDGIASGMYDMVAVVEHEIDELLGVGGGGSFLGQTGSFFDSVVGIQDLFRYTSTGVRTYTTVGDNAWFSIDGGHTLLAQFNNASGGDYGDWHTGTSQVQSAYGTPGQQVAFGTAELVALDVVGWTFASSNSVPEPGTDSLILAAMLGVWLNRRRNQEFKTPAALMPAGDPARWPQFAG